MATNVFTNPTFVTNEGMRHLKNNLQFLKHTNTDFESKFTETPAKGETIKVRKDTRFIGRSGEIFADEAYVERTVDMTVQTTAGVDLQITNRELMFNFERFSERVLKPAMMTLGNIIESAALGLACNAVANVVGTPGTIPTSLKTYNQARAKMSWEGAPQDNHTLLITPDMQVEAVDQGKLFFNPAPNISEQYETGVLGKHYGANVYEVQNLPTNTYGVLGGIPIINGAPADGATTVVTSGWTAAIAVRMRKGNRFTFATTASVNPWTRQSIGANRIFTLTADASSDGAGAATLSFSPPLTLTGPFQNILALPLNGTAITPLGTTGAISPCGLRFHRDAFLFGSFAQPLPGGVEIAKSSTDPETTVVLRFIRDWDTKNNRQINRFDVVWAWGVAFQELACVIAS